MTVDAKRKTRVYVAGPYTKGNTVVNVREAIAAGEALWSAGYAAYVPHLTMLVELLHPHPWETWIERDRHWLEACDVLLRLPGESDGADREVARAMALGMPVYCQMQALLAEVPTETVVLGDVREAVLRRVEESRRFPGEAAMKEKRVLGADGVWRREVQCDWCRYIGYQDLRDTELCPPCFTKACHGRMQVVME